VVLFVALYCHCTCRGTLILDFITLSCAIPRLLLRLRLRLRVPLRSPHSPLRVSRQASAVGYSLLSHLPRDLRDSDSGSALWLPIRYKAIHFLASRRELHLHLTDIRASPSVDSLIRVVRSSFACCVPVFLQLELQHIF
jgi:hypothetical protein